MNKRAFRMLMLAGAAALLASGMAVAEEHIEMNPQDDRGSGSVVDRGNRSGVEELVFRVPERGMTVRRLLRVIGVLGVDLFWNDDFRGALKRQIREG